jgi:hypothetical protein
MSGPAGHSRSRAFAVGLVLAFLAIGCGPPTPRTRDEILRERYSLPRLYLTQTTNRPVIAAGDKGAFIDEATGEMCWPALACYAEDCPGRGAEGKPYLFSSFAGGPAEPHPSGDISLVVCPACAKAGRPTSPGAVGPHILPEMEHRLRALDEEYARRVALEQQRL